MIPAALPVDQYFKIYYLNERAVTVEFGTEISEQILQQVSCLQALIRQQPFPGFTTAVAAYATLSIFYDPVQVMQSGLPGEGGFEKVSGYLQGLRQQSPKKETSANQTVTIPVCYGGIFGPDLAELAQMHQLSISEVIKLHSTAVYEVYMIGFLPGFAYLGGLPDILATPRKAMPRQAVPMGSVGIAGAQTGVYPLESPGGWQIIGQTPLKMFDSDLPEPTLLNAGDEVVFKPIDHEEFLSYR